MKEKKEESKIINLNGDNSQTKDEQSSTLKDMFEKKEAAFIPKNIKLNTVYTPLADYVVVEVLLPEKSKGGIYLPDSVKAQEKDKVQRVLAVGPDCKIVKEGNLVLIGPMCRPMTLPIIYQENDPIQHIQVREYELMGIVDNNYQSIIKESETKSTLIN